MTNFLLLVPFRLSNISIQLLISNYLCFKSLPPPVVLKDRNSGRGKGVRKVQTGVGLPPCKKTMGDPNQSFQRIAQEFSCSLFRSLRQTTPNPF